VRRQTLVRITVLLLLVCLGAFGAAAGWIPPSASELRDRVGALGPLGPPAFVAVWIGLSNLHVPPPLLCAAAGLLFGTVFGTGVAIVAATLAACTQFLLGRYIVGEALRQRLRERAHRLSAFFERRGLLAVVYLRLVPGIPFVTLNYVAGLSSLRLRDLVVGTAVGIAPKTFAYVALGGSGSLAAPEARIAIALIVLIAVVGAVLAWRSSKRDQDQDPLPVPTRLVE
jgi:uncharacterized membrane protein YdjX (TVP38/TMEM64 family)